MADADEARPAGTTVKVVGSETRYEGSRNKRFTVYLIEVQTVCGNVIIFRRYSTIRELYNALRSKGVTVASGFPKKNRLRRMSLATIETRIAGLTAWFADLMAIPDVLLAHPEVSTFLSLQSLVGKAGTEAGDRPTDLTSLVHNRHNTVHARAMFDFTGEEGELELRVGDIVKVSMDGDDLPSGDWWEGTLRGSTGAFPASYVTVIGSGVSFTPGLSAPDIPPRLDDAEEKRRTAKLDFLEQLVMPVDTQGNVEPMWARALYDYDGEAESDIGFSAGDMIEVLEVDDDTGWWLGRIDGREGLFPSTFVAVRQSMLDHDG